MTYEKFLPEDIPAWQEEFWHSLKAHKARIQRCVQCGSFRYVPKEICYRCHSSAATWEPIQGTGTVYTFTVVRRAPTPAFQADSPYTIVHVEMDEGVRMVGLWASDSAADVYIDMPVRLTYDDITPDWTILRFEPIKESAA